ncbi:MAG: acylase [Bacteroidota bacterium]
MNNSYLFLPICLCLLACQPNTSDQTRIIWDSWGVPHVYAQNETELFYAQGWAQMHNHANTILELYGTSRGRAAEYWGSNHLASDILIHKLGFPELAKTWKAGQTPEHVARLQAFVDGMNAYVTAHPKAIKPENEPVLPITIDDPNLHGLFVFYSRFVGGGELGTIQQWQDIGSNTYAIGPSRSASGKAMLVQNPHLPWFGEFLFFEWHANAPGINTYGVNLVGFPGFGIAFNEHLGWSHTNNTIDNADSYELTLQGDGYLLDGEEKAFEKSSVSLKIKTLDGQFSEQEIELLRSEHGAVLKKGNTKAIAIRFPAQDRVRASEQWWRMSTATSFDEFEAALKEEEIPFWNVMYADKAGNIFYLFNGHVPKRSRGDFAYWNRIIPGDDSEDIWTDVHPYEDLPKIKNPKQDWLQNANDPPWTSTWPMELKPADFPAYMSPVNMPHYFRPQRSVRMLAEDESITFDELVEYKLSTRLEMADRLLDDLAVAVEASDNHLAKRAMTVLQDWDRETNMDSKGAVLFEKWAYRLGPNNPAVYAIPYDQEHHLTTPDGLADPVQAVNHLVEAAKEINNQGENLSVLWGKKNLVKRGEYDLPSNGASGALGAFRVASTSRGEDGKNYVRAGDSWVSVIEFGDKVRAKVLLSYGNATQQRSRHNGDQLVLFAKKEFRDALFYREDLTFEKVERTEFLNEDGNFSDF